MREPIDVEALVVSTILTACGLGLLILLTLGILQLVSALGPTGFIIIAAVAVFFYVAIPIVYKRIT